MYKCEYLYKHLYQKITIKIFDSKYLNIGYYQMGESAEQLWHRASEVSIIKSKKKGKPRGFFSPELVEKYNSAKK